MKVAVFRLTIVFPLLVSIAACGGDNYGLPTGPGSTTVQVAGVWDINETRTSVSGGECFASAFQSLIGQRETGTLQIQQSGASLSATATDGGSGGSCSYSGSAVSNAVALNVLFCTASDSIGATCPIGGAIRNVRLLTGAFNGTVFGRTITGTVAQTYNITTAAGDGVGTLTLNSSFTANRR